MWILLRNKRTGRLVAVMVSHNKSGKEVDEDKGCKKAQAQRLADILSIEMGENIPILFGCDFNNGTETESYGIFRNKTPFMAEAYEDIYGESPTWGSSKWRNAGGHPEKLGVTPNNIDFLFYSRKYFKTLAVLGYPTEDLEFCNLPGYKYPSDHFAHMAIYEEQNGVSEKDAFRQEALFLAKMRMIKQLKFSELTTIVENKKAGPLLQKLVKSMKTPLKLIDARKVVFMDAPKQTDTIKTMPMTVSPSDTKSTLPFTVSVNLRRTYEKTETYWKYLEAPEFEESSRSKSHEYSNMEYCRLLAKQEVNLRKHNAKRNAMTQFDLQYSAYVLLCNYLCSTGQKKLTDGKLDSLTKKDKMSLVEFGKTYKAFNPKTSNYGETILKAVAKKLGASTPENRAAAIKWAYTTYDAMKPDRKAKKTIHCLKGYDGRCETCFPSGHCKTMLTGPDHRENGSLCKCGSKWIDLGCGKAQGSTLKTKKGLKIEECTKCKGTGTNKDYGVCKNTQKLPKPHKTKEACEKAGKCEWCPLHFGVVRRRRLGDSAAYLLDRHQQMHGVRTPPVLATLLEEIEEAQRNWRPRRR